MSEDVALPKLVLLPGMDGTGELFAPFVVALPRGFEVITVGFPRDVSLSYAQLAETVQSLLPESDPFVIVAESFSTPIAIECARSPANLKGVVVCAGFVTSPIRGLMRHVLPMLAPFAFRAKLPKFLAEWLFVGPRAPEPLVALVQETVASVQLKVLTDRLQAILGCDARTDLAKVYVPILYLQAAQDKLVPSRCVEEIRQIRPDVKIVRINGPHFLLQREPQKAVEAIVDFLKTLS